MDRDDENDLRTLSIFHYVLAGLSALFGTFPLIHLFMGIGMLRGAFAEPGHKGPPEFVAYIFISVALVMIVLGWTVAGLLVFSGRFLRAHRKYTFCLVVAGISCLFVPFGTLLGVFTIMVLQRPTARALFT